jgi:ABC-2 type transport system permease protein
MRNVWTIARREYRLYFASPVAYVVAFFYLIVIGYLFYGTFVSALFQASFGQSSAPGVQIVVGPMVTLLLFATPAITMRLIAEEQRLGTMELLLTAPVRDWELVTGKWLGGFMFMATIIAVTLVYPIFLNKVTSPGIDQGTMITGYLGILLIAAAMVAIGVAVSSLFSNQIAAFFITLGVVLILWLIGIPTQSMGAAAASNLIRYLDFSEHFYNTLYRGIIDLSDVVYYLSVSALAIFLGSVSVETRRWR